MPRPKEDQPTAGELEVLKVLWDRGPSTVREVMDVLNQSRPRAYTSVMSLLNVMAEKRLLVREARGRAFVYRPRMDRGKTLGRLVGDLLRRARMGLAIDGAARLRFMVERADGDHRANDPERHEANLVTADLATRDRAWQTRKIRIVLRRFLIEPRVHGRL